MLRGPALSSTRPLNVSLSTAIHESGAPRDDWSIAAITDACSRDLTRTRTSWPGWTWKSGCRPRLQVHFDVAVTDELARSLAARRETHAIDDVVEAALERGQQVVARDAGQRADASRTCCGTASRSRRRCA